MLTKLHIRALATSVVEKLPSLDNGYSFNEIENELLSLMPDFMAGNKV